VVSGDTAPKGGVTCLDSQSEGGSGSGGDVADCHSLKEKVAIYNPANLEMGKVAALEDMSMVWLSFTLCTICPIKEGSPGLTKETGKETQAILIQSEEGKEQLHETLSF
jgi:hypothetical protein